VHLLVPDQAELVARLALAIVFGSAIGLERERAERAAGLRTHALVCLGAATFTIVSAYGLVDLASSSVAAGGIVRYDPTRIAAQIVSGIGFLGAGTIIFRREIVRGLTTAAGLWVAAGIGMATGAGMYVYATAVTAGSLLVLAGFKPLEGRFFRHPQSLTLEVHPRPGQLTAIREIFRRSNVRLERVLLEVGDNPDMQTIRLEYAAMPGREVERLLESLATVPGVVSVEQMVWRASDEDRGPDGAASV
jgi:putative Mg2+ transporter-C (MgtC) family protein